MAALPLPYEASEAPLHADFERGSPAIMARVRGHNYYLVDVTSQVSNGARLPSCSQRSRDAHDLGCSGFEPVQLHLEPFGSPHDPK